MSERDSVHIIGGLDYAGSEVVHIFLVDLFTKNSGHLEILILEHKPLHRENFLKVMNEKCQQKTPDHQACA
jgi:hypothetical protein